MVKYAPKDALFIGQGRWSWLRTSLEDENLIQKVITRGIDLQSEVANWETLNTD
jgi:hypothetical protein